MATWGKGLENPCGNTKKKMGKICFHLEVETQQAPNNSCNKSRDAVLLVLYSLGMRGIKSKRLGLKECPWVFRNVVASLDVY